MSHKMRGFSLAEIVIALVLVGLVVLTMTSVDITSRQFFGAAETRTRIQDEAKIAMEHIVKNVQLGIGDMSRAEIAQGMSPPSGDNSRGFYILDAGGNLATSGSRIQVKQDDPLNPNGQYGDAGDPFIEYEYVASDAVNNLYNYIRFYPDATVANRNSPDNFEVLAEGIVESAIFSLVTDASGNELREWANRVNITITVRKEPGREPGPQNPETTLTSSVVLRGMSTN